MNQFIVLLISIDLKVQKQHLVVMLLLIRWRHGDGELETFHHQPAAKLISKETIEWKIQVLGMQLTLFTPLFNFIN